MVGVGVGAAADDPDGWRSVATVASPAWYSPYVLTVGSVDADTGSPSDFSLHDWAAWTGLCADALVACLGTRVQRRSARDGEAV
mgnify:CR=1 FL=1